MTRRVLFFCLFISHFCFSQTEKYPTFEVCKNEPIENIKDCFYKQVKETFYERFKEPPIIKEENFEGTFNAVFVVTNKGQFKLIYLNLNK